MSKSHPLQTIVTKLSTPLNKESLPANEVFLIVDAVTHEIIPKLKSTFWSKLSSAKCNYYLIRTAEDYANDNAISHELKIISPCEMTVSYKAWCPKKGAQRLAANVDCNGPLEDRIDNLIRSWIKEIIEHGADRENQPADIKRHLGMSLETKVKEEAEFLAFSFSSIFSKEGKEQNILPELIIDQQPTEVDLRLEGYGKGVKIKSRLRLTCKNAYRYLNAGTPPLKAWVEDQVRRVVNDHAWGKSYSDFLSEFVTVKDTIRSKITQNAIQNIGYEVQQLITEPDVPEIILLSKYELPDVIWDCETLDSGAKVKIQVVFSGRLQDFKSPSIQSHLRAEHDIRKRIEEDISRSVESVVKNFLHGVRHEEFYKGFWPNGKPGTSYEEQLKSLVVNVLHEFRMVSTNEKPLKDVVFVKMGKSDIMLLLDKLIEIPFCLNDLPITRLGGGEQAHFNVEIRVTGVDVEHFSAFVARAKSVEAIKNGLQRELLAILSSYPKQDLWFIEDGHRQRLMLNIGDRLNVYAKAQFGIVLEVASLLRKTNVFEEANTKIIDQRASTVGQVQLAELVVSEERWLTDAKKRRELMVQNADKPMSREDKENELAAIMNPIEPSASASGREIPAKSSAKKSKDDEN